MSLPSQVIRQRDFTAGEVNPSAARRDDSEMFKNGVRYARNLQTIRTGALERRYGRRMLYADEGVRDSFRPFGEHEFSITFAETRVTIRDSDGVEVEELTAPWTDPFAITWDFYENKIFVCGDFRPQVIEVNEQTGVWTIGDFEFDVGLAGVVKCPFFRFPETKNITMRPSALTGSITVTFSAPVLNAQHVGVVFEYAGKQLQITVVTNATTATATVIQPLNPTIKVTAYISAEIAGFVVGESIELSVTGTRGVVTAKVGDDLTYVITNRFRKVENGDRVVGPGGDMEVNAGTATNATPAATTEWRECFMSDYRGWPRSVSVDNQRVIFTDFPQNKSAIIWSAISAPQDLLVTAEATGAIFELIQADCRVYHVVGGYDEFAITDAGVFYIPISSDSPLAPGSVEFRKVYSGEVSSVRPVQVTEGLLFVDVSLTGIYAVTATGQTARPYAAQEISEFHRHLFSGIRSMAATAGTPQSAARQIFVVNDDGTVVIGQYNADRSYVGWLKWDGAGEVQHVASRRGDVVLSTIYPVNSGDLAVAEQIDPTTLLDFSIDAAGGPFAYLANTVVQVVADGFYLGDATLDGSGALTGFSGYSAVKIGFNFEWTMQPNLAAFEGGESYGQRLRRRKISKVMIKVSETTEFKCGNRLFGGYKAGDDTALPMPLRDEVYQYRQTGRSYDPVYELSQSIPGPFTLQELTTEVTV